MVIEINFVADVHRRLAKTYKKDRVWFKAGVGIFVGVFVLFLGVVGVRFYFISQLSTLQQQELQAKNAITANEQLEKEYTIFTKKLNLLTTLFDQRLDKQSAVDFFTTLFGSEVLIRELDYGGTTGDLQFVIEAPSVFVLDTVVSKLKEVQFSNQYKSINTSELQRSTTGSWTMRIAIDVSKLPPTKDEAK